jgi:hypothetical protein
MFVAHEALLGLIDATPLMIYVQNRYCVTSLRLYTAASGGTPATITLGHHRLLKAIVCVDETVRAVSPEAGGIGTGIRAARYER